MSSDHDEVTMPRSGNRTVLALAMIGSTAVLVSCGGNEAGEGKADQYRQTVPACSAVSPQTIAAVVGSGVQGRDNPVPSVGQAPGSDSCTWSFRSTADNPTPGTPFLRNLRVSTTLFKANGETSGSDQAARQLKIREGGRQPAPGLGESAVRGYQDGSESVAFVMSNMLVEVDLEAQNYGPTGSPTSLPELDAREAATRVCEDVLAKLR